MISGLASKVFVQRLLNNEPQGTGVHISRFSLDFIADAGKFFAPVLLPRVEIHGAVVFACRGNGY